MDNFILLCNCNPLKSLLLIQITCIHAATTIQWCCYSIYTICLRLLHIEFKCIIWLVSVYFRVELFILPFVISIKLRLRPNTRCFHSKHKPQPLDTYYTLFSLYCCVLFSCIYLPHLPYLEASSFRWCSWQFGRCSFNNYWLLAVMLNERWAMEQWMIAQIEPFAFMREEKCNLTIFSADSRWRSFIG